MKKILLPLIVLLLLTGLACRKKHSSAGGYEYMIIGAYYQECMGKCAYFYQIKDGKVMKDTTTTLFDVLALRNDTTARLMPAFKFEVPMATNKYTSVQDLYTAIPAQLYNENYKTYGMPDNADQGSVDVYIRTNGVTYKWTLDPYLVNKEGPLKAFMERLSKAFVDLQ